MRYFFLFLALMFATSVVAPRAAVSQNEETVNFPQVEISNGVIRAKLYLPDPERGYYRGVRFDWSGQIASLTYKGHEYFGKWFPRYDPNLHDAIMGPVEEFRSEDGGLGYSDPKAGGLFVKIGVGVLKKLDDEPYRFVVPYPLVNGGTWIVRPEADSVEFVHELKNELGYNYVYKKTVRLAKGKPELILEHRLENKGKKPIVTAVYDHDFYMLDHQPTGPAFTVKFPFALRAKDDLKGLAKVDGNEFVYLRELQKGESAATYLEGFGHESKDYDIRVENRMSGAGVRQTSNRPIAKLYLWSIRTTVCPEAYIDLTVDPGRKETWRITYDFYTLSQAGK